MWTDKRLLILILLVSSFAYGQRSRSYILAGQASAPALYNVSNAASPTDEANTVTGFTDRALTDGTLSFTSVTTAPTPQDGSYSVRIEHTGLDNNDSECYVTVTGLENGSTYQVEVYAQEVVGTNWRIILRTGFGWTVQDTELTGAGGWTKYTLSGTTDTTSPSINFGTTTSGQDGDQMGIDNIVITKL